ncbi:MAG TPA: tetratricopeptide repeat protein [Streptosporangiaceae bacterium]|nr:tetratricopeptide repeat protein [Streptosporangiaceae bacterium]
MTHGFSYDRDGWNLITYSGIGITKVLPGGREQRIVTGPVALDFAGLLRWLRAQAKLTQEELAEAAGLSPRTISDLERGLSRTARKDTARWLAEALGLNGGVRMVFIAAARGRAAVDKVLAAIAEESLILTDAPADPDLPALALAGPAALSVPRELPAEVSAFIGRKTELAELDALLPRGLWPTAAAGPVVISAVSGTAGVGKTALAIRWARRAQEMFPDGQLYVNLRGYDPGPPVPAAEALAQFLVSLGVLSADIPTEEEQRAARYRSLLADKKMLVVLDNAVSEEQVRPLLPGSPAAMVVVTSRDALPGLVARDGARRLNLDLLPTSEAFALLRALIGDRADADPAATATLAEQCARLPLALRVAAELAVARPGIPLADLSAELANQQSRVDKLDAGGDPRAAVASVFSWSYRHLHDDAARMFRLLGLHVGVDWDRYSAAALADISPARATQLLDVLAQAHLIQPAGAGRYGLHDLLRAYAAGLAADHDHEQVRRAALTRLFDYYLAAAATATNRLDPAKIHHGIGTTPTASADPDLGDQAAITVAWLDAELSTLTAVAAYTAAQGWPGHTIRLAVTLHRYLWSGHWAEGLTVTGHALTAARSCGDRSIEAHALTTLGNYYAEQGRHQQAADHHRNALAIALEIGDQLAEARALNNLAAIDDLQGRYQQAADGYQRVLDLDREIGNEVGAVIQLANLATVYLRQGRYDHAADHGQQALTLARKIKDKYCHGIALATFGTICYLQGHQQQARDYQRKAIELSFETGNRSVEAYALTRLSEVCHQQGQHHEAAKYDQRALGIYRQLGDTNGQADALNTAGERLLATSQPRRAHGCYARALTLARNGGNRYQQARAHDGLAAACNAASSPGQALQHRQHAQDIYTELGIPETSRPPHQC